MKNKKGQVGLQEILYVFIAVLVGVVLFQAIAQQVGSTTNTVSVVDSQHTAAANGASFYLTDYRAVSGFVAENITNGTAGFPITIAAGNYTVTNNVVYDGALAVKITVDDAAYASETWNLTFTAQPLTYIADSGARSMAALIVIFFALLVAVIAISPVARSGAMDLIGK